MAALGDLGAPYQVSSMAVRAPQYSWRLARPSTLSQNFDLTEQGAKYSPDGLHKTRQTEEVLSL